VRGKKENNEKDRGKKKDASNVEKRHMVSCEVRTKENTEK
jgi:hypothetical protein